MVSLLAFTSCASEYKIEGSSSVSRLDGKMLFVKVPSGDRMLSIDSAEVIHGMFKMEGITDSTSMASLYMDDESIMPFVIEKGKISISIDNARIVVTGTPLNDRLYDFVGKKTSLDDRAYELERQESRMIMDGKAPDEIQREITREREKLGRRIIDALPGGVPVWAGIAPGPFFLFDRRLLMVDADGRDDGARVPTAAFSRLSATNVLFGWTWPQIGVGLAGLVMVVGGAAAGMVLPLMLAGGVVMAYGLIRYEGRLV